jgi:hypothetical protein
MKEKFQQENEINESKFIALQRKKISFFLAFSKKAVSLQCNYSLTNQ